MIRAFEFRHGKLGYIAVMRRELCQVGVSLDPLGHCRIMADGSFPITRGLNIFQLQYCMLRYITIRRHEQRIFGVSLRHHRQLKHYGWWSFPKTHCLNSYQLQYQCLRLLSIWVLSWQVKVSLRLLWLLWHDVWWSFTESPWPQLISHAI